MKDYSPIGMQAQSFSSTLRFAESRPSKFARHRQDSSKRLWTPFICSLYLKTLRILVIKMPKVDEIKLAISQNKVVVYSKTYCPYCRMAKEALADAGLKNYLLIELDNRDDGDSYQNALSEITGGRTVRSLFCRFKRLVLVIRIKS